MLGQYPSTYAAKRKARRFTMQGLYEWQLTHNPSHEIEARTLIENAMHKVDVPYYHHLLKGCIASADDLDALFTPFLDRKIEILDGVELAILRLSSFEMKNHLEIPYKVVIDEAIELAKDFGATDSHKYINGVLDQLARQIRAVEIAE